MGYKEEGALWKYPCGPNDESPIGLLGDREENTVSEWLKKRTQVKIISRDRYSNYQSASTKGAPDAIQVTDRWHLLKNLGEAMRKILDREHLA
ncbi:transposase [Pedobacter jamesrossensis]|uniref:transposase n=1 Tax=Pedobacter jamesrossensis TaxID=1908238 RepID=UPI003618E0CB